MSTNAVGYRRGRGANINVGRRFGQNQGAGTVLKALQVRKIPPHLNNITKLNEHFGKFGQIINIQVSCHFMWVRTKNRLQGWRVLLLALTADGMRLCLSRISVALRFSSFENVLEMSNTSMDWWCRFVAKYGAVNKFRLLINIFIFWRLSCLLYSNARSTELMCHSNHYHKCKSVFNFICSSISNVICKKCMCIMVHACCKKASLKNWYHSFTAVNYAVAHSLVTLILSEQFAPPITDCQCLASSLQHHFCSYLTDDSSIRVA